MPIQFSCTKCGKILRTPDASAGKAAKCPQCGTVLRIPAASEAVSPVAAENTAPVASAKPAAAASVADSRDATVEAAFGPSANLSGPARPPREAAGYDGAIPAAAIASNESGAVGHDTTQGHSATFANRPVERIGPPWEARSSIENYFRTLYAFTLSPNVSFRSTRITGGTGKPFMFFLISMVAMTAFAVAAFFVGTIVFTWIVGQFLPDQPPFGNSSVGGSEFGGSEFGAPGFGGRSSATRHARPNTGIGIPQLTGILVAITWLACIFQLYLSAITSHVALRLVSRSKHAFEGTFRAIAYSYGTTMWLSLFTIVVNGFNPPAWGLVLSVIGISRIHNVSVGKAIGVIALSLIQIGVVYYGMLFLLKPYLQPYLPNLLKLVL